MTPAPKGEIRDSEHVYFGITSAVGSPIELTINILKDQLAKRGYGWEQFRLSQLSEMIELATVPVSTGSHEYQRIKNLMMSGNDARRNSKKNAILAMFAVSLAAAKRSTPRVPLPGSGFLFRQLKHPEEAYLLRNVYDEGFHLIGVHCPESTRLAQLQVQKGLRADEAKELIATDAHEGLSHGQRVRDTFHLADVFIRVTGDAADAIAVRTQMERFVGLLFGDSFHTPTIDEYGMFLAWAAGLRSAQLSRQVGAAVLTEKGEVLGLGTNEVPRAGGGQYWEGGQASEGRDHTLSRGDATDYMKHDMLEEILKIIDPGFKDRDVGQREALIEEWRVKLGQTRIMNLTEFTRAAHAEMEAVLSATRTGRSVVGATLYTTTFPCHNCTKHILAAGIGRVIYVEPYPKSLAYDLHPDAMVVDEPRSTSCTGPLDSRINFEAFVGIAPRRYADLFAMTTKDGRTIRRKDSAGNPDPTIGLRLRLQLGSYIDRENLVADEVAKLTSDSDSAL